MLGTTIDAESRQISADETALQQNFFVLQPLEPPRTLQLAGARISIGSDPDCNLRLLDPAVARMHALIVIGASRTVIRSQAEGLFLNGAPLTEAELHPGDLLRVGDSQVIFLSQNQQAFEDGENESNSNDFGDWEEFQTRFSETCQAIEQRFDSLQEFVAGINAEGQSSASQLTEIESRIQSHIETGESMLKRLSTVESRMSQFASAAGNRFRDIAEREQQIHQSQKSLKEQWNQLQQQFEQHVQQASQLQASDSEVREQIEQVRQQMQQQATELRELLESTLAESPNTNSDELAQRFDEEFSRARDEQDRLHAEVVRLKTQGLEDQEARYQFKQLAETIENWQTQFNPQLNELNQRLERLAERQDDAVQSTTGFQQSLDELQSQIAADKLEVFQQLADLQQSRADGHELVATQPEAAETATFDDEQSLAAQDFSQASHVEAQVADDQVVDDFNLEDTVDCPGAQFGAATDFGVQNAEETHSESELDPSAAFSDQVDCGSETEPQQQEELGASDEDTWQNPADSTDPFAASFDEAHNSDADEDESSAHQDDAFGSVDAEEPGSPFQVQFADESASTDLATDLADDETQFGQPGDAIDQFSRDAFQIDASEQFEQADESIDADAEFTGDSIKDILRKYAPEDENDDTEFAGEAEASDEFPNAEQHASEFDTEETSELNAASSLDEDASGFADDQSYDEDTSDAEAYQEEPSDEDATNAASEAEDENSIEDYMSQLMNRVRGMATENEAKYSGKEPASSSGQLKARQTQAASIAQPKEEAQPEKPRVPRERVAPPEQSSLAAMRDLANLSTRGALATHTHNQKVNSVQLKLILAVGALVASLVLLWFSQTSGNTFAYVGSVASMLIAIYFGVRYLMLTGQLFEGSAKNKSDEKPADASTEKVTPTQA